MAAKILHSLTDDNQDLHKQLGSILTPTRPHKNLPPVGIPNFNGGTVERELNDEHTRPASTENIPLKNIQEKQRISTESSRASYSSLSRSFSSSALECGRASRFTFPEISSRDPTMSLQSSSPQFSRQNRDLVKESMHRKIHGLSVKAKTAEEALHPVMKCRDSPRLQSEISKGSHVSSLDTKQWMHENLKQSLRVVAQFQEAPWHHNERRQLLRSFSYHSRDGSSSVISRDSPRFSFDQREVIRAPFDSRDVSKSTLKLKDLPRLSLDGSKSGSMLSLHADFLQFMQQDSADQFESKVCYGHKVRSPGVVAKLMGLETLPHSVPAIGTDSCITKSYPAKDLPISRPSAERDLSASKPLNSSKNLRKERNSPHSVSSTRPLSRCPIEPAPWKRTDGSRNSQKSRSRTMRAPAKGEATFPSVYSEIEKRLKDLEFTQSGKDLRALKHILKAMQSKKLLQSHKEVLGPNLTSHKEHDEKPLRFKQEAKSVDRRKKHIEEALAMSKTVAAQHNESPSVIMKPAKPALPMISLGSLSGVTKLQDNEFVDNRKGLSSGRKAKDLKNNSRQECDVTSANMKSDRTIKATQTSRSHHLAKDGSAGSGKSSGSISPRLQQKKLDLEKRACPPALLDSSKSRRQPNKQLGESNSPGGRQRPKDSNILGSGEKLSEIDVESRSLTYSKNENMVQSNASATTSESMIYDSAEEISTIALHEEKSAEFCIVPVEYSSPVSVLDNRIHKDDSPSLVKYEVEIPMDKQKSTNVVQGSFGFGEINILGSREYCLTSEICQNKLQNFENRLLNASHEEAGTDDIASLCENTDPDNKYISEILLSDIGSSLLDFRFHSSGHPINPELFLVLEQTKASSAQPALKEECIPEKYIEAIIKRKIHRKLLFDAVNEILERKLVSTEPWLRQIKLTRMALNSQKLLREVCSEIESLQSRKKKCNSVEEDELWKAAVCMDVMHHNSERWTDFDDEISGAVLDVERSIFKDLVNEIVIGESAGLKTKPACRHRSFSK